MVGRPRGWVVGFVFSAFPLMIPAALSAGGPLLSVCITHRLVKVDAGSGVMGCGKAWSSRRSRSFTARSRAARWACCAAMRSPKVGQR